MHIQLREQLKANTHSLTQALDNSTKECDAVEGELGRATEEVCAYEFVVSALVFIEYYNTHHHLAIKYTKCLCIYYYIYLYIIK